MESAEKFHCVFVTAPSLNIARKLAAVALNQRLVACANLIPKIESHYWWQGKLESASEVLIIFKTTGEKLSALEQCVLETHPYDTPEFIAFPLHSGSEKYLTWITTSTLPRPD